MERLIVEHFLKAITIHFTPGGVTAAKKAFVNKYVDYNLLAIGNY